jgi:organic hydroperoxide reductase OsmC/OhrA
VRCSYQRFTGVQPTTNHEPVCLAPTDPARGRTNTKEEAVATTADVIRNGVDTERLFGTLDAIKAEPSIATFQFRARNRWIDGAHNRTTIRDFYAANQEDTSRVEGFVLDAGEPAILLGTDTGPNPAEYLLHALAACLTTSLVYVAAARGVHLTEVESTVEGDIDVRGHLASRTSTATASSGSASPSGSRATHRRRSCASWSRARSSARPSSTWSPTARRSRWTWRPRKAQRPRLAVAHAATANRMPKRRSHGSRIDTHH